MFKVTFSFEDGSVVEAFANAGDNLLEVARGANVAIDAPCSGNGACGKCRVQLKSGELESKKTLHISDEEYRYSSSEICNVFLLSSSPLFNWTRHFPQAPFPEHGASIATLAPRATSSKLSPALANASTTLPSSNENVTLNIRQPPFS